MTKLKNPLMSLKATGGFTKLFSLAKRQGRHIIEQKPIPTDAKSSAQLFNRHMFTKCVDLWHLLSDAEKQLWESAARPKHMTGYAWYISQCLRPNPGIYLPLQGGEMSGDIDMSKHRLLRLPLPTHRQEAASKYYHDNNLPPGGYTEGAKVRHSANQSIPNASWTALAFNTELYDTDTIHDNVTNNSRLTCKTAGKYIIVAEVQWATNVAGRRKLGFWFNNGSWIGFGELNPAAGGVDNNVVIIADLGVNDYVELKVFQDSGGALICTTGGIYTPIFMMQRIG